MTTLRPALRRLAAVSGLALVAAAPAPAARYAQGEEVEVTGRVTDLDGEPLAGVEVVLAGHRKNFDVWGFQWQRRGESAVSATTDAAGAYSLVWRWDRFYNRFRLAAGIRQSVGGEETWWEVASADLTRAVRRGSPVIANLTVESADEVRSLQAFVEGLSGDDARRVYRELGKPDKVSKVQRARHVEVTWWYFERGMLYRFVDGRLDSSESFEPVEPI